MQNTRHGGLSGKARRARGRSRAARLCTHQLVMDYLDPEPKQPVGRANRLIPVRPHSESILPSAPTFEHVAHSEHQQLELVLSEPGPERGEAICCIRPGRATADSTEPSAGLEHVESASRGLPEAPALRLAKPGEDSPVPFTFRGFICGCAIGAAAATVALLILQVALR